MNGLVIGVPQTFDYFNKMQERIIKFIVQHSHMDLETVKRLMFSTSELANDVGTVIVGPEAVNYGLINDIGGLSQALAKLQELIKKLKQQNDKK
jgi:ATP-dependent protease ClpP protease subunit